MNSVVDSFDVLFLFGDHDIICISRHSIKEEVKNIKTNECCTLIHSVQKQPIQGTLWLVRASALSSLGKVYDGSNS